MRHIYVEEGLRVRFPERDEAFNEGVEIGLLLASMAAGLGEFTSRITPATLEQARILATRMGYRIHVVQHDEDRVVATFLTGSRRPKLTLVHKSAG